MNNLTRKNVEKSSSARHSYGSLLFLLDLVHYMSSCIFALREQATLYLPKLPDLHRDPFGRILICRAIVNGLCLLTPDPLITRYPVHSQW